ncbi:MAG: tetratricopeptide repeat protein [Deltaproteobacteria bacterium]|nr:tetratricopeptide repeat protein [Deltaproteobacteria bacterium]
MRWAGALVALSMLIARPAWALEGDDAQRLAEAELALRELRVEEAGRTLAALYRAHGRDPELLSVVSLHRFHIGDYPGALRTMEQSLELAPETSGMRTEMLALYRGAAEVTDGFARATSPDGRYVVLHAPGRDATLVPYAMQVLKRMDEALQEELAYRHPGPIRLEIYGSADQLASVSTLTVANIERTGTIALCKWDRLMVTSPRALLRGYPWMDTIAHEMVHLYLARQSEDHAPVWIQEGVAKLLERRWRKPEARAHLTPAVRGLVDQALENDSLIPFEQLHPSIALLPSQQDAALAFAQVSTFLESYVRRHGAQTLRDAIARIRRGADARVALGVAADQTFDALEAAWREDLGERAREEAPEFRDVRFRRGEGDDDLAEVREAARRKVRLGDLLWSRRRYGAAAEEYGDALEAAPGDPIIASRLARAALAAGNTEEALRAIRPVVRRHPEHEPARALLASILRRQGAAEAARHHARLAVALNPFDPRPHCDLAEVERDERTRQAESRRCSELGGSGVGP